VLTFWSKNVDISARERAVLGLSALVDPDVRRRATAAIAILPLSDTAAATAAPKSRIALLLRRRSQVKPASGAEAEAVAGSGSAAAAHAYPDWFSAWCDAVKHADLALAHAPPPRRPTATGAVSVTVAGTAHLLLLHRRRARRVLPSWQRPRQQATVACPSKRRLPCIFYRRTRRRC